MNKDPKKRHMQNDKEQAEDNACRIEHVITPDVFCGITEYMKDGGRGERVVREWDILVAVTEGKSAPQEEDVRELNIHLW